ncbi:hypothetical protein Tco_1154655, partial [Tanacetum coccineum]
GVIVVEDDPDVIHVDNSSDLALSTSLNDLEIAALHIDGQSIDVDAPPDIIDVVDEDDDIIDEEDPIPHDLADSDDEDLVNLDIDDGVNVMSADVARGHGGDGGGDDRPPSHQIPTGCGGCLGNRGKGTRKPNLGGRRAGRQHTRQETRNLGLKAITDKSGPVTIRFEFGDRDTLMPLGEHAAHWANYLGELVRELPLHYPSWRQVPAEQKAGVMARIGTQFDMRPHMESDRWPLIYAAIQQHLQKIYNGKKAALKDRHWIPDSDGTYDLERIRLSRPLHISETESSATREYPSLIHTFFLTHTVNGVFLNPEDKALYDEMLRLQGLGSNTETGVPDTEDEIMAIVRGGKQRGHIPGVGRLFRSDAKFSQMLTQLESQPEIGGSSGSGGHSDDEQGDDKDDGEDEEDEDDKLVILVNIDLYLADNASFESYGGIPILQRSNQFQVFKSLCKSIGLRSVIRIDHQELKKVIWYVLHNSPEIDTYRAKFKSEFPDNDMKEAFPGWFGKQIRQRHVDNDPGVSESSELFALACGPSQTPISVNSCVVNGIFSLPRPWMPNEDIGGGRVILDVDSGEKRGGGRKIKEIFKERKGLIPY